MQLLYKRLEGESGHDAAYALLAQHLGYLPEIYRTPRGKPYFSEDSRHFSISHTSRHAFCCIDAGNIGMDAEECDRPIPLSLARRILSPGERQRFVTAENPHEALLRFWVLKEALAKLTGRGWGDWLKCTDFSPNDPRIQVIDGCFVAVLKENDHAV